MKRILFFASTLFLLCYLSCVKEEEVDFKYPRIYTTPVSDITSSGARFSATIDFPNPDQITAFGFIWGEDSKLSGATFTLPPDSITGNLFYADIRSSLIDNKIYYVRSFVIKSGKTVYGNMVSFKSLGSEGPKITQIDPAIAAFGDTVHVIGKNFTSGAILKYGTQDISSSILKTDKNKLTFILPGSVPVSPVEDIISLTIEGNVSRSPMPLKLDLERILPKILSITPLVIKACDTITIRGKNFLLGNYPVEVSYNLGKLVVIKATKDSLVCIVKNIPKEEISFSIYNGRFYAYSQGIDLTEQRPEIISVSPLIYKSKDIITVKVKNFPYCDESMYAITSSSWNGSYNHLPILSKSKDEIKVQLPEECLGYFNIIFVMQAGNYYLTQYFGTPTLSPEPPEVYSIEPNHGSFGDEIVIKGSKLKDNLVSILDITSSSDTEVRGTLIQEAYTTENGFIDVIISGCGFLYKENGFKYDPIEISDFNPKLITSQSQLITITGKNFSSSGNTILIGSSTYQNITSDDYRTITIPASALLSDASQDINQSLSITVQNALGKMATSPIPLVINHEASWYRLLDFSYPGIHSGISFSAGGKGYAGIGSYSPKFWQYDPAGLDTWQQLAAFPGQGSGSSMVSASANGKGYVGLDVTYNKEWWEYDPATDSWNKKQDYPGALAQGAFAFEIGGKVYVGGGNGNYEFWEYNPATDTWARKTNLPGYGGRGTANFGFKGKGYVYGTSQNGSQYFENTYNPASNTWTTRLIAPFGGGDYQCMIFENYVIISGVVSSPTYPNAFFKVTPGIGNLQIVPDYAGSPRLNHISFAIGNFGYFGLGQEANSYMESLEMWRFDPSKFK